MRRVQTGFLSLLTLVVGSTGCNDSDLQGLTSERSVTEVRLQGGGNIDVLWVVDNSGSMEEEQVKLGANFLQFIQFFYGLEYDFRLAVVTTDMNDPFHSGRFLGSPTVLEPDTPNLEGLFVNRVNVGTSGNKRERGLDAARRALSEPLLSGENRGFLRDDALLAVIVVSDEDDGGSEDDRPPMPPISEYVDFFTRLKGSRELFSLSVIAGDLPMGCQSSVAKATPAFRYDEMVTRTGGTFESICEDDFGPVLTRLGAVISGFKEVFPLELRPDDLSLLQVSVDGQVPPQSAWRYDPSENAVVFEPDYIPEGCSQVTLQYSVTTQGAGPPLVFVDPREAAFTCPSSELPRSSVDSNTLEGGNIACAAQPGRATWPGSGGLLLLLVLGWTRRNAQSA